MHWGNSSDLLCGTESAKASCCRTPQLIQGAAEKFSRICPLPLSHLKHPPHPQSLRHYRWFNSSFTLPQSASIEDKTAKSANSETVSAHRPSESWTLCLFCHFYHFLSLPAHRNMVSNIKAPINPHSAWNPAFLVYLILGLAFFFLSSNCCFYFHRPPEITWQLSRIINKKDGLWEGN